MHPKTFSTNLKHDYLLFLSKNSDIKIMNVLNGKEIGQIEGAHSKGTTSYQVLVNKSMSSRLSRIFKMVEEEIKSAEESEDEYSLLELFVEQLNDYIFVTGSSRDKLKVWKFDEGISKLIASTPNLGGIVKNGLIATSTMDNQVCIVSGGDCSNKLEFYIIHPNSSQNQKINRSHKKKRRINEGTSKKMKNIR